MKYKLPLITILGLGLLLVGLGCKGLSKEEQASIKPVTLQYWTVFNDIAQLQQMIAEYKKMRPYVTVKLRQVRHEEFDLLFTNALADDVGPDIASIHTRALGRYINRLSPMPPSVQVATVEVKGQYAKETIVTPQTIALPTIQAIKTNFITTVYEDVIYDGSIYGLPLAIDTMAIYYNKDLLDKVGVPEPPKTWADFVTATKKATLFDKTGNIIQSGVALGAGYNIDNAPDIVALLMLQNKVEMTKGKKVAFAAGLDKPGEGHPAIEAMRFYTNFAEQTTDVYTWNEFKPNALDEFVSGSTVFYFGFSYDYPRIKARAPQMNVEILSLPQLDDTNPINVANYWIESVVKKSKHQNEAWDFVHFLTTKKNIGTYAGVTRRPAPLRSLIAVQAEDPTLAPFLENILTAKNWYRGNDIDVANTALRNLIVDYIKEPGIKETQLQYEARLITNAAKIIQQTM